MRKVSVSMRYKRVTRNDEEAGIDASLDLWVGYHRSDDCGRQVNLQNKAFRGGFNLRMECRPALRVSPTSLRTMPSDLALQTQAFQQSLMKLVRNLDLRRMPYSGKFDKLGVWDARDCLLCKQRVVS